MLNQFLKYKITQRENNINNLIDRLDSMYELSA